MSCNCQQNTCCQGQYGNFDNNGYANYFNSNIGNGFTPQPIIAPIKYFTIFKINVEQPVFIQVNVNSIANIVYVPHCTLLYEQSMFIHKQIVTKNRCLASSFCKFL